MNTPAQRYSIKRLAWSVRTGTAVAVVLSDEVGVVLAVDKVVVAQLYHLFESIVDEDKADKSGEALFCEAREVLHQEAGVRGDEHQAEHARPQTNPQPELEVVEIVVSEERRGDRSAAGAAAFYCVLQKAAAFI